MNPAPCSLAGTINGIRFYKGAGNGGTHLGHLWTNGGALLAEATFTGETASGWQTARFATPVPSARHPSYPRVELPATLCP